MRSPEVNTRYLCQSLLYPVFEMGFPTDPGAYQLASLVGQHTPGSLLSPALRAPGVLCAMGSHASVPVLGDKFLPD